MSVDEADLFVEGHDFDPEVGALVGAEGLVGPWAGDWLEGPGLLRARGNYGCDEEKCGNDFASGGFGEEVRC